MYKVMTIKEADKYFTDNPVICEDCGVKRVIVLNGKMNEKPCKCDAEYLTWEDYVNS